MQNKTTHQHGYQYGHQHGRIILNLLSSSSVRDFFSDTWPRLTPGVSCRFACVFNEKQAIEQYQYTCYQTLQCTL